jgi:hypothetical protein
MDTFIGRGGRVHQEEQEGKERLPLPRADGVPMNEIPVPA